MTITNDKPLFTIRIVAAELGVHPQTLRLYETRGLISPYRSEGNTRFYSQNDIDRIRRIIELSESGINTSGINQIMALEEKVAALEKSVDNLMNTNMTLKNEVLRLQMERGGALAIRTNTNNILAKR